MNGAKIAIDGDGAVACGILLAKGKWWFSFHEKCEAELSPFRSSGLFEAKKKKEKVKGKGSWQRVSHLRTKTKDGRCCDCRIWSTCTTWTPSCPAAASCSERTAEGRKRSLINGNRIRSEICGAVGASFTDRRITRARRVLTRFDLFRDRREVNSICKQPENLSAPPVLFTIVTFPSAFPRANCVSLSIGKIGRADWLHML